MRRILLRPARVALMASLGAVAAFAHVVSMSTGDLKIEDRRAHYELRMPLYEMSHVAGSEQALFERRLRCPADQERLHCGPRPGAVPLLRRLRVSRSRRHAGC